MRIDERVRGLWRRPGCRWALVALGVYVLTTLIYTYPVPLRMGEVIAGAVRDGDAYQYTWSLWWAKRALLDPDKGLAHLTLMNHPVGLQHPFMVTLVVVNLAALPFSLLFSPAVTYNAQVLLSFVLAGMSMYALLVAWTEDRRAALLGGFIFAFFPNKMGHVLGGHLPQITVWPFPLYALLLWRVVRRPRWRRAGAAAVGLVIASLTHPIHLTYLTAPITGAVLVVEWLRMGRRFFTRRRLGMVALAFGLAMLVVVPVLWPTVRQSMAEGSYLYKPGTIEASTDLLAFLSPSPLHPLLEGLGWAPAFSTRVFPALGNLREGAAYLGVVPLALALWGLLRRRRAWIWGAVALLAAVFSLGPLLKVGGQLVAYQVDGVRSHVVLPYVLLKLLPVVDVGRTPGRLNELTMFALAVLAAYGLAALPVRWRGRPGRRNGVLLALVLVVGLEYLVVWPLPTATAEIPPAIRQIAGEEGPGALLHLRMERREVNHPALYYQTFHRRPVVGGKAHRVLPETVPWQETLEGLARGHAATGDAVPQPTAEARAAWLRHFDVEYVIAHKLGAPVDAARRETAERLLGPPRYEDDTLAAFRVPSDVAPAPGACLYTFGEEGWSDPLLDGGVWRRWLGEAGELYLYTPGEETGQVRFTVDGVRPFAPLQLSLDGRPLDAFLVEGRTTYATRPVTLTGGMHVLRFEAPEGCRRAVGEGCCWRDVLLDPPPPQTRCVCEPAALPVTCRSFVLDHLSFTPLDDGAVAVDFGDRLRLRRWTLDTGAFRPGGVLTATLEWEPLAPPTDRWVAFVHLLSPEGVLVAQRDAPPVGRLAGDVAWPVGAALRVPMVLPLPADLPPGEYQMRAGVYLWPELTRLPVVGPASDVRDRALLLGRVTWPPEDARP